MIVSLTSPATKLLSVRFHFVDNNLCSLIIKSPLKFPAALFKMFSRTCDVRHVSILFLFCNKLGRVSKKIALFSFPLSFALGS